MEIRVLRYFLAVVREESITKVEYAESIYVGYRYYEKAGIPVQFPFGYGMSYTSFEISDMKVSQECLNLINDRAELKVTCKVKNIGDMAGAEVVQVYVADQTPDVFKAVKELKGFCKVFLQPGEKKEVTFTLGMRAFAHYDVNRKSWEVLSGTYRILMGTSGADTPLAMDVKVQGTVDDMGYQELPEWYRHPTGKPSVKDFEKIYGQEILPFKLEKPGSYTLLNTFNDMKENPVVQQIIHGMTGGILQSYDGDESNPEYIFTVSIILNTPLVRLVQQGGGATPLALMQAAVGVANGDEAALAQLAGMMGQ